MSAADTVKDVLRIATTAGLAKDVIDLLERKTALLTQQVSTLEQENTTLLRENRNLALENQQLKTQIQDARPKGDELAQTTRDVLLHFFKSERELSERELAQHFQMELNVAVYHTDLLWKKKFIDGGTIVVGGFGGGFGLDDDPGNSDNSARYSITVEGRAYVVEHLLAN